MVSPTTCPHHCCIGNTSIADSMGNSLTKPEEFITTLIRWLSACCGSKFTFVGKKLPVGSQRDATSCGFFAINAISHSAFDTVLLTNLGVWENRLQWFNDLCNVIAQYVMPSNLFYKIHFTENI